MERSNRGPTLAEIMAENGALKKALQDFTSMLALVAYNQEDKQIEVSFEELSKLPPGSYVDVTVDKQKQCYILRWQPADAPPLTEEPVKSTVLIT